MTQKALILSDENSLIEPIKATLSDAYFIVCLKDSTSVIQNLNLNEDIRALIIDIDTKNIGAEQLLETLSVHATFKKIKTIVLAHPGDEKRVLSLLNKGVNDFLLKPINPPALKILLDLHMAISDDIHAQSTDTNIIFNRLFLMHQLVSLFRERHVFRMVRLLSQLS